MHANPVYNYTTDTPNSWMSVDLGAQVRLRPTHYCLRNDGNDGCVLRHWVLEGSVDEEAWRVLRQHQNDTSLQGSMSTAAWPVEAAAAAGEGEGEGGAAGYYRYFRVRQTGKDSSGKHHYLCCAGMELYGTLRGGPVFANAREVVLAGEQ